MVKYNPHKIIFFESSSAGPVYWYLRTFGKSTELKIHYHEYTSPNEYEEGMRLVKLYHQYEKKFLYEKADWISQTNEDRVKMFLQRSS